MYAVLYQNSIAFYKNRLKHDLVKYIHLSGVCFTFNDLVNIIDPITNNEEFMKDY